MQNPFEQISAQLDRIESHFQGITPKEVPKIEVIGRDELCKRLGITEPTAIRWEKRGLIPSFRIGSNVRYNWYSVVSALEGSKY